MKFIYFLILSPLFLFGNEVIHVGFSKPAMLVFNNNTKITYGSEQIEATSIENKVLVKALVENFEETNLFVEEGNQIHVFTIRYKANPEKSLYNYKSTIEKKDTVIEKSLVKKTNDTIQYNLNSKKLKLKKQEVFDVAQDKYKMLFLLSNINVANNDIYMRLVLKNNSEIDYNISFVKFEIRNTKKKFKKTSVQNIELTPKYVFQLPNTVKGNATIFPIFTLDEFVLDKNRKLHIEVWEKSGDRILQIELDHKTILKTKQL
jgi:hypothetical protein